MIPGLLVCIFLLSSITNCYSQANRYPAKFDTASFLKNTEPRAEDMIQKFRHHRRMKTNYITYSRQDLLALLDANPGDSITFRTAAFDKITAQQYVTKINSIDPTADVRFRKVIRRKTMLIYFPGAGETTEQGMRKGGMQVLDIKPAAATPVYYNIGRICPPPQSCK